MISEIDGGIRSPSVPAPARVPTIMRSGYWRWRSSGIDILPTVATVAADDPEMAAKMAQPATLVCSRPPGRRASQGVRPLNSTSDRRERNRISPIQMNMGSAVSVHDDCAPQRIMAMESPVGRLVNSSMPIQAQPSRAAPTHTPEPNSANSDSTKIAIRMPSLIPRALRRLRARSGWLRPRPGRARGNQGWRWRSKPHPPTSPLAGSTAGWRRRPR